MIVAGRIGREYAMQLLNLGVTVAERIVLTAVLLRLWGVTDFAIWSLATAAAGLVSMFDLGANLYFANRVFFLVQQGRGDEARRALRAGNLVIGIGAIIGTGAAAAGLALWAGDGGLTPDFVAATLTLSAAAAVRMAVSVQMSVYRAHGEYARQTFLLVALDTARIAASIGLVAAGLGYAPVALAQAAVTFAACAWILFVDCPRRFPAYPFRLGLVPRGERREAARISFGYWAQSAPTTALTYAPVFVLTTLNGSAAIIAQFVLMRTIGNFGRMTLQMFAIVLGQEAARRLAIDDRAGLKTVYKEASAFLAVQTACATGLLVAIGRPLFILWTGESALYDPVILWLAIGTLVLLPSMTLAHNLLATANHPWPAAAGRTAQLALTLALMAILPIDQLALRMMAALAVAELVGYGFPLVRAADRLVGLASIPAALGLLVRSLACAGITFAAAAAAASPFSSPPAAVGAGVIAGGAAAALAILMFGMGRDRRSSLIAAARARIAR